MDFSKIASIELLKQDKTKVWLAEQLGVSQQAITKQFATNNFKESRMREIADALGCDLVIELRPKSQAYSII